MEREEGRWRRRASSGGSEQQQQKADGRGDNGDLAGGGKKRKGRGAVGWPRSSGAVRWEGGGGLLCADLNPKCGGGVVRSFERERGWVLLLDHESSSLPRPLPPHYDLCTPSRFHATRSSIPHSSLRLRKEWLGIYERI